MATLSKPIKEQTLLAGIAKPYEIINVQPEMGGGYTFVLRTNVLIHQVHTDKTAFRPHSFYTATWLAVWPIRIEAISEYVKNFREATSKGLAKGDYEIEKFINGEWQSVKAKYNQWFYYDARNQQVVGGRHSCPK